MYTDPIKPGLRSPDQWMPLFLAQLARSPDLEVACRSAGVSEAEVEAQRAYSGYFSAAYRIILREHRIRAHHAGLPVDPIPKPPDFRLAARAVQSQCGTPVYPRSWMRPFLVAYAETGRLDETAELFRVNRGNVLRQIRNHPAFAEEFARVQGIVAMRLLRSVLFRADLAVN